MLSGQSAYSALRSMRRKEFTLALTFIMILASVAGLIATGNAPIKEISSNSVHNIDTNEYFTEIQAAIDDPDTVDGNTIEVSAGTYYEHIIVDKSLTLVGENRNSTIIDGTGYGGTLVQIIADSITFDGFNVRNCDGCGIVIWGVQDCILTNNIVSSNEGDGIDLYYCTNVLVDNNLIEFNHFDALLIVFSNFLFREFELCVYNWL